MKPQKTVCNSSLEWVVPIGKCSVCNEVIINHLKSKLNLSLIDLCVLMASFCIFLVARSKYAVLLY